MVELRKRPAPAAAPPPPAKKAAPSKSKAAKPAAAAPAPAKETKVAPVAASSSNGSAKSTPKVGDSITLDGFGGEIETNVGEKTTLSKLVESSGSGVVLFTYPKASTPGCTTQACLFRDSYEPLTAGGLAIYGLSTDSPKANTTFKEKQKLPYPLLCDPKATLIAAIGFKKSPSGTTRGVFVVDKSGKVLAAGPGGPAPTVEVVKKLVAQLASGGDSRSEDKKIADTAAEVADTAAKVDKA